MHVLLPAHRGRPADHLLGDLRRPAALPRACSSTTPTRCWPPRPPPTRRTSTRRSCRCSSTRTTRRCRPRPPRQGIPRRLDRRGAALAGLRAGRAAPGRAAAAPGVPHPADGLVHPAAVAGRRHRPRGRATTRPTPTRSSPTIDSLRIPVEYLANLFTAGDADTVRTVLRKLAAIRAIQRAEQLGLHPDENLPASVGASVERPGGPVPAARDRQVRRPLRHPARPRRGRRAG